MKRTTLQIIEVFTGAVMFSAAAATPPGWLLCDGAAVSRATYANLFSAIGTTFGTGDGSTTFNLPDNRGRVAIGAGSGSGLTARTRGQTTGAETHVLDVTQIPAHTHKVAYAENNAASGGQVTTPRAYAGSVTQHVSESVGGGLAHNNMQPSIVLSAFIKI